MSAADQMRASDAERERVAEELRDHTAAGRLTPEELEERLDDVFTSRTVGELARVREDLPNMQRPRSATSAVSDSLREAARRRIIQDAGVVVLICIASVLLWLISGAHGGFWPKYIIVIAGLRLARDGWVLLGPGGHPELAQYSHPHRHHRDRHRRINR